MVASPEEAWNDAWGWLGRAVKDRRHAFRTPVVSTVDAEGLPRSRTVVLRAADAAAAELVFHTDLRSDKLAELARTPVVAWCFYDAKARLQLRARGTVVVDSDSADADAIWASMHPSTRRTYLCKPGPGSPLSGPGSGLEHLGAITAETTEPGRSVFARVHCRLDHFERLDLAAAGHRRIIWSRGPDGWQPRYVVP